MVSVVALVPVVIDIQSNRCVWLTRNTNTHPNSKMEHSCKVISSHPNNLGLHVTHVVMHITATQLRVGVRVLGLES